MIKDQYKPNLKDLEEWEGLCIWLDNQYRKASYSLPLEYKHLISQDKIFVEMRNWLKDNQYQLIFYSSGWGWRLRKDWKDKINRLREQLQ